MSDLRENQWRTADDPRHMLRLSRMRSNGRKYALLACAVVRHLIPGKQTEVATRVLDVIEKFAVAQPAKGIQTRIWREVVQPNVPEVPDRLPYSWTTGNGAWLDAFAYRLGPLSQVCPADINVLYDFAFRWIEADVRGAAAHEVAELCGRFLRESDPKPLRSKVKELREEVVSRFAPERRGAARAHWVGSPSESNARRAAASLVNERVIERMTAARAKACELVREVFANPFRPLAIEPAWLLWNHGAVKHIAESIAASGNFAEMPILGDALEDAGCRDEDLLRHCREERTHVPGCWALDAVLGRG